MPEGDFLGNFLDLPAPYWKGAPLEVIEMIVRDSEERPVLYKRAVKILHARRIHDICDLAKRLRLTARMRSVRMWVSFSIYQACCDLNLEPKTYYYEALQVAMWRKYERALDQTLAECGVQGELFPDHCPTSLFPEAPLPKAKRSARRRKNT